jgi:hypothetical protein
MVWHGIWKGIWQGIMKYGFDHPLTLPRLEQTDRTSWK